MPKGAMRETAQQFEALFLQMMMKSMRESIVKSEMSESNTMETFEGMFDKEVSVQLAKKNSMGLADMLVKNLEQQQANIATTADILKQRQDPAAFNAAAKAHGTEPHKPWACPLDKVLNPKLEGIALPKPQSGFGLTCSPHRPSSIKGSVTHDRLSQRCLQCCSVLSTRPRHHQ